MPALEPVYNHSNTVHLALWHLSGEPPGICTHPTLCKVIIFIKTTCIVKFYLLLLRMKDSDVLSGDGSCGWSQVPGLSRSLPRCPPLSPPPSPHVCCYLSADITRRGSLMSGNFFVAWCLNCISKQGRGRIWTAVLEESDHSVGQKALFYINYFNE